jgi:hypothetical protein
LNDIAATVKTQFLPVKVARWILQHWQIPATLRVWSANRKDTPIRYGKDCPNGKAQFAIGLYNGHYFLGDFQDA